MEMLSILTTALATGGEFLSEAGKKALSEQVIITGIILWALRGHFKKIETGLANVANNVSKLGAALTQVETSHSERIVKLESRVSILEKPNQGEGNGKSI